MNIDFKKQYSVPPSVSVAIAALDVDSNHNTRLQTSIRYVTTSNFQLYYDPYANTALYGVKFSWVACA
jgi:hypothetical protein